MKKRDKVLWGVAAVLIAFTAAVIVVLHQTSTSLFLSPHSCEWATERAEHRNLIVNCFDTADGSLGGYIEQGNEYSDYWNAHYIYWKHWESLDEWDKKEDYATFKDLESAKTFLNRKLLESVSNHPPRGKW